MMMYIRPFTIAREVDPANLAVTATSQSVAIPRAGVGTQSIRIVVSGTVPVFFKLFKDGTSTVTTSNGIMLLANTVETFLLPNDVTNIAFIATATGSSIQIVTGESA